MKSPFKLVVVSLAIALCGGSFAAISAHNEKFLKADAKVDYVAIDEENTKYEASGLISALETTSNKTFTILSDFTLTDTIDIAGRNATIDLDGYTITGNVGTMFSLSDSSNLTINSTKATGSIANVREKEFELTGANLTVNSVNIGVSNNTSNYVPINASSGSNIIRLNNVRVSKGQSAIKLSGSSYLYAHYTVFSDQNAYSIYSNSSSCSINLSGIIDAQQSIYTNSAVNFFNGNIENPTYLEGLPHRLTIIATVAFHHEGDIIVRGAINQSLFDNVRISMLTGTGYDYSIADGTAIIGTKDLKIVYYSCTPEIDGEKFTIISQDNPAVYSVSDAHTVSYVLEADIGYYFGSQRADYLEITIGASSPLTSSDYTYSYTNVYYGVPYYKRCTITIKRKLIKGQLSIYVTPGVTQYLQTAKNFVANNLHMDDYDPELTGEGSDWCKDNEHHYYTTAKEEFLKLGNYHREVFMLSTDDDVVAGRNRFIAWARANHEEIVLVDGSYLIVQSANTFKPFEEKSNNAPFIIIVSSICVISIVAIAFYSKTKKKRNK